MNGFSLIGRIFSQVPIFGGLGQATASDHQEALKELAVSLLISTCPIWGGSLALYIVRVTANETTRYWQCLQSIIQNGELFIYAASTLAPVIYIVTRDRSTARSFPSKFTFIMAVLLVALFSAIIFSVQRVRSDVLPSGVGLSQRMFMWLQSSFSTLRSSTTTRSFQTLPN